VNAKLLALLQELAADANLAVRYPQYRQAALEILTAADDVWVASIDAAFVQSASPSQHLN
jgi:hypothetical protein